MIEFIQPLITKFEKNFNLIYILTATEMIFHSTLSGFLRNLLLYACCFIAVRSNKSRRNQPKYTKRLIGRWEGVWVEQLIGKNGER